MAHPGGAPTKYDPKHTPELARWISRDNNFTKDEQIAKELKISLSTLKNWKKRYPEFLAAIKTGKAEVDRQVEDSLLKLCLGYEYDKTEYEVHKVGEKEFKKKKETRMHVPPDATAIIFWLTNRKRGVWNRNVAVELDYEKGKAEITEMFDKMKKEAKASLDTSTT